MDGRCPALVTKDQDPLTSGLQRKKLGPLLAGSGHGRGRGLGGFIGGRADVRSWSYDGRCI